MTFYEDDWRLTSKELLHFKSSTKTLSAHQNKIMSIKDLNLQQVINLQWQKQEGQLGDLFELSVDPSTWYTVFRTDDDHSRVSARKNASIDAIYCRSGSTHGLPQISILAEAYKHIKVGFYQSISGLTKEKAL